MFIVEQIKKQLVDPDNHGPYLDALVAILDEQGEKGVKDRIKKWIDEIEAETPPATDGKE